MIKKCTRIVYIIIIIIFSFEFITLTSYDLHIQEYIINSMPFSEKEKDYLNTKRQIKYASDKNAPPIAYINPDNNQYEGLIIDYMSSISIEVGVPIHLGSLVWADVQNDLKLGAIDVTDLFESEERKEHFLFSQPIYILKGVLATLEPVSQTESVELKGKKVAIPYGDFAEEFIRSKYKYSTNSPIIVNVQDIEHGLDLIVKNEVDFVAGDEPVIGFLLKSNNLYKNVHMISDAMYEKNVCLAVKNDNRVLLSILNKGILNLKKEDTLIKIQQKWFNISSPIIKSKNSNKIVYNITLIFAFLITAFYFWSITLHTKIEEKTIEIDKGKKRLREIIDSLNLYIVLVNKNYDIIESNLELEKFLKLNRSEIINKNISNFQALKNILDSKHKNPKRLGKKYYIVNEKIFQESKETKLITIEDVTEKIVAENKIRQESKMIAVGNLSAGLAHEVRNPLGLIKSYLYVIRKYIKDENAVHALNVAENSTNRINELVQNLLYFSRLSSDEKSWVLISELIKNIMKLEEKKIFENNIHPEYDIRYEGTVFTSQESLKIVLFNLIDNAVESMLNDDKKDHKLSLRIYEQKKNIIIEIEDTGHGVDFEIEDFIFNPFFTTKNTGTGLGLYNVNLELKKIDGNIEFETEHKGGTCFRIFLPKQDNLKE